ncbi:TetR/AcrR family transcriptional regulator [bacterium]|nr:TetR/AcrR family transcriptional regulator [bacterium]
MPKQALRNTLRNTREEVLERSIPLFAAAGFDGVSMRDIAVAVGVTPAALYHHFSDKEQLYLGAIVYAFEEKVGPLKALLTGGGNPWERIEEFITRFVNLLAKEKGFRRLMQWVMLDSDERRLRSLVDCVFQDLFKELSDLASELAPGHAPHLLVVSMIGLVIYPFETLPVRRLLPGYHARYEDHEAISRHIVGLLRNGLGGGDLPNF